MTHHLSGIGRHRCQSLLSLAAPRRPTSAARSVQKSSPDEGLLDSCPLVCEPDGYTSGIVKSTRLKYHENPKARMPMQRRGSLQWQNGQPSNVLIIKKPRNKLATAKMREIGEFLTARGLNVIVETNVQGYDFPQYQALTDDVKKSIDFCITLGGDGTLLYLASLFDQDEPMPPIMSFAMGTLGFLTPFDAAQFETSLTKMLAADQTMSCTLRTRLRCEVVRRGNLAAVHHVMNEVVVDRGSFPGSTMLEVFIDDSYMTTVEADGLIIATPSGSTAYSLSVGGSLIAPSVPCTILSPIAPHSLSFRPVVIPETSSLCLCLSASARSSARVSFDGKNTMLLSKGTFLNVDATLHPLPTINLSSLDTDWYEGLTRKLKWNQSLRPTPRPPRSAKALIRDGCPVVPNSTSAENSSSMQSGDWDRQ